MENPLSKADHIDMWDMEMVLSDTFALIIINEPDTLKIR
jgi:hypothetical protein